MSPQNSIRPPDHANYYYAYLQHVEILAFIDDYSVFLGVSCDQHLDDKMGQILSQGDILAFSIYGTYLLLIVTLIILLRYCCIHANEAQPESTRKILSERNLLLQRVNKQVSFQSAPNITCD